MFHAMPEGARFGRRTGHRVDEVQGGAISRVADGMNAHLKSSAHDVGHQPLIETIAAAAYAAMSRTVGVIREQLRAARAKGAIVVRLHRAHGKQAVRRGERTACDPATNQCGITGTEHGVHAQW